MKEMYINAVVRGNYVLERYLDGNNIEHKRKIPYKPSLFTKSNVKTDYKDIYGKYVKRKKFNSIYDAKSAIDSYKDVIGMEFIGMENFAFAYISDTYKNIIPDLSRLRVAIIDIEVTAPCFPNPSIADWEIDALTHYDSIDDKFYSFGFEEWNKENSILCDPKYGDLLDKIEYTQCINEKELLIRYLQLWREKLPAFFTGWNSSGFDTPYIYQRMRKVLGEQVARMLSPWNVVNVKNKLDEYKNETLTVEILGVPEIDYMILYKKFVLEPRPTHKLDYIGEIEVGSSKVDYSKEYKNLADLRKRNYQLYIDYNIGDVELVCRIDDKRNLFNLAINMAYYANINFTDIFSPLRIWDAILFNSLKSEKIVVPLKKSKPKENYVGAWVKDPMAGLYEYVCSFDLTSLYPHVIMQYNISLETIISEFNSPDVEKWVEKSDISEINREYVCNPSGVYYDKHKRGIIPIEIEKVFLQRKHHKKLMQQHEQKLLLINKEIQRRGL